MQPQKVLHLHKEKEKKKPNIFGDFIISEKLDGWYTFIDYNPTMGFGTIMSGAQRFIPSMAHGTAIFNKLPRPNFLCRFIMEATIPGVDFYELNGIFNRSVGNCEAKDTIWHIHDCIPLLDLTFPASKRLQLIENLDTSSVSDRVKKHPVLAVSPDEKVWMRHFDKVIESGGEGIVLKAANSPYSPGKRNSSLMKVKLEEEYDLKCIKLYWTKGEKGNDNLNLDLVDKAGTVVPVRIGAFKDIDAFTKNSPVGKVITIKCMHKTEEGIYREPRFKCCRYDKQSNEID